MSTDATGSNGTREAALKAARDRHRQVLEAKLDLIRADREAGQITPAQAADALRSARAVYDRDTELAEVEADTGWQTWSGVGGLCYARLLKSSPPKVVRAATAGELAAKIRDYQGGTA